MSRISTITPEVNLYGRQTGIENTMFKTFKSNKDYMKNLRNYILDVIKEDSKDYPNEPTNNTQTRYGKTETDMYSV